MTRTRRIFVVVVAVFLGTLIWQRLPGRRQESAALPPVDLRGPTDQLTLALTGDTTVGRTFSIGRPDDDTLSGVGAVLQSASLAITDLDQRLVEDGELAAAEPPGRPRWPAGSPALARELRQLGFSVVTLGNGHAADDGGDGVERARHILTGAGLWHAGAASDLADARRAVVIGAAPRRVAVLSVATSVLPFARATRRRGDVAGRPGVSALKYRAVVTADPQTFLALSQVARTTEPNGTNAPAANELQLAGTVITKGTTTRVELVADAEDLADILREVRSARANADVVVVSLHSHEPDNRSQAPPNFVRSFAQQAIDAGAALVVGHGPRQLRGIEVYHGGAILYSLGSFAFKQSEVTSAAANLFDTDVSLFDVALGAVQNPEALNLPLFEESYWWQSVIATATITGGTVASITLTPIDLGATRARAERGVPRLATAQDGAVILERIGRLSADLGTRMDIRGEHGVVAVPSGSGAGSQQPLLHGSRDALP